MKYIEGNPAHSIAYYRLPTLELTRRNLETLLEKLDDPMSERTLMDGDYKIKVTAVTDAEHYSNRPPGTIFMPSSGEYR